MTDKPILNIAYVGQCRGDCIQCDFLAGKAEITKFTEDYLRDFCKHADTILGPEPKRKTIRQRLEESADREDC